MAQRAKDSGHEIDTSEHDKKAKHAVMLALSALMLPASDRVPSAASDRERRKQARQTLVDELAAEGDRAVYAATHIGLSFPQAKPRGVSDELRAVGEELLRHLTKTVDDAFCNAGIVAASRMAKFMPADVASRLIELAKDAS